MQWVAYVECLGLYAAVHRSAGAPAAAPALPLIVLAGGAARDGCPLAFGQGLRVGMPQRQALRQAPGAVCAELGSVDYQPAAHAFWAAGLRRSPRLEPLEPHRLFLGLPVPGRQPPTAELGQLLAEIPGAVAAALGLPAEPAPVLLRAGLAANKLTARAAAETARPGAPPVVVPAGGEADFLGPLPVAALWRARPELLRRMAQLGLTRVGDLARVSEAEMLRQFGAEGSQLARWARGEDPDPVRAAWPPRSVVQRIPFPAGAGSDGLPAAVGRAAQGLARRLQQQDEVCQAVSLTLELEAGATRSARRTLPRRQQGAPALAGALLGLLHQLLAGEAGLRCLALTAAAEELAPAAHRQLDLWGEEVRLAEERAERLARALAAVQSRFPDRAVRVGWQRTVTRREAMFQLYDPLRLSEARSGAAPAARGAGGA